jgi:predicted SprT family Zn-dependent metalloprotease
MIVYSKKIIQFIYEIKSAIKEILSKEIRVKVKGDRFYDQRQTASYPIKVVIYNDRSMLGYFDSNFYELGFHERLMHAKKTQLRDVIRHELAHYFTCIEYGETIQPHGIAFREFCERAGWGREVYTASLCLENEKKSFEDVKSSIFRKVQKLMALATSSNRHEAEQAMVKSQQLLMKHNLDTDDVYDEEEEKVFLKRILKQTRENAKLRAIATILETFFVSPIYNRVGEFLYLEIVGSAVNIEIAEYVAGVLHIEMERLWVMARREASLQGLIAKNSFFQGLAKGYCNKIEALKREYPKDVAGALIIIEKKLDRAKSLVYDRLSTSRSYARFCRKSSALGESMGKNLNFLSAIDKSPSRLKALIAQKIEKSS